MNELKYISIEEIVPNPWNPQVMDDATQERLTDEIAESGFTEPIVVAPLTDGKYQILGGEHRWLACKENGWEEMPCLVLTDEKWETVDLKKFITVKMNMVRGKLNPQRMRVLYDEMADKYGKDSLARLFGFTDLDALKNLVGDVSRSLPKSMPPEIRKEFKDASKDIKTVEDLSCVIQNIFAKYGDSLKHNFMVFTYDNREHIYIIMDKATKASMKLVTKYCNKSGEDINDFMSPIIKKCAEEAGKKLRELEKAEEEEIAVIEDDVEF